MREFVRGVKVSCSLLLLLAVFFVLVLRMGVKKENSMFVEF